MVGLFKTSTVTVCVAGQFALKDEVVAFTVKTPAAEIVVVRPEKVDGFPPMVVYHR